MTAAERIRAKAKVTTYGRWVRVTNGAGRCHVCNLDASSGWRWFHNQTTSSAFVCDGCAEEVTS